MSRSKSPIPLYLFFLLLCIFFYYFRHDLFPRQLGRKRPTVFRSAPERRYNDQSRRGEVRSETCNALGVTCSSTYFSRWSEPDDQSCHTSIHNGYPVPDAQCTPGGIDSSVTIETLRNPGWRTRCIRNCATSEAEKHRVYEWYGILRPKHNSGQNQVCELDHLVPLELGGADGPGNIWPEYGPDAATLNERYFKIKDRVENYLADEVRAGRMPLNEAQKRIALDWTQFLDVANAYCRNGGRC